MIVCCRGWLGALWCNGQNGVREAREYACTWLPLVSGPALAIDNRPGLTCLNYTVVSARCWWSEGSYGQADSRWHRVIGKEAGARSNAAQGAL